MVRLKALHGTQEEICSLGFNSTMVRLKVDDKTKPSSLIFEFQFHNGSIKSVPVLDIEQVIDRVSIPQWFD